MNSVNITVNAKHIAVTAPYNAEFFTKAQRLGGKYVSGGKFWQFKTDMESSVRNLCETIYGKNQAEHYETGDEITEYTSRASAIVELSLDDRAAYWFARGALQMTTTGSADYWFWDFVSEAVSGYIDEAIE